jgi:hypothetical protein
MKHFIGYSEIGATMDNKQHGLERAMTANASREAAKQRMETNTSGLQPINRVREGVQHVGLDARLQVFGTKYTQQQIEQAYTQQQANP